MHLLFLSQALSFHPYEIQIIWCEEGKKVVLGRSNHPLSYDVAQIT
jgi:hypothetical protein